MVKNVLLAMISRQVKQCELPEISRALPISPLLGGSQSCELTCRNMRNTSDVYIMFLRKLPR